MAGMRGGGFGGGRGNAGRPWGGEGPVVITLPSNMPATTASPLPTTLSTVAQDPSHTLPEPAPTTRMPPSPSLPPGSVPSSGAASTSSSPSATVTDTPSHGQSSDTQTSGATSVQETAEGSASISVSFTIIDGQTIRFVTTVTAPSEATAATAANAPRSSSRGGIVAVATLSSLLLAALAVALGIFLLRRRIRRARAVQSRFIHGSADSDSDVAPAIRAFSMEPRISRPLPVSNRDSNVLDEENARLREAVARLQDQLEDLGHADNPSLPAYDSHSAASHP